MQSPALDLDGEYELRVSGSEVMLLLGGLDAYLTLFAAHRAGDGGVTHPEEEWQELRREIGQLIWRLESACRPPGAEIEHSANAVPPDPR